MVSLVVLTFWFNVWFSIATCGHPHFLEEDIPDIACGRETHILRVGPSAIESIVKRHNDFRKDVAMGKYAKNHLPEAANMNFMAWNDELALIAGRWALQCNYPDDTVFTDIGVGQNLYYTTNVTEDPIDDEKLALAAIDFWMKTLKNFKKRDFNSNKRSKNIGNLIQLLWAKTIDVGCAIRIFYFTEENDSKTHTTAPPSASTKTPSFQNNTEKLYDHQHFIKPESGYKSIALVCDYGPKANKTGGPIYEVGDHCSKCENNIHEISAPKEHQYNCARNYQGLCTPLTSYRYTGTASKRIKPYDTRLVAQLIQRASAAIKNVVTLNGFLLSSFDGEDDYDKPKEYIENIDQNCVDISDGPAIPGYYSRYSIVATANSLAWCLHLSNEARSKIARGVHTDPPSPQVADMTQLEYNMSLSLEAFAYIQACIIDYVPETRRNLSYAQAILYKSDEPHYERPRSPYFFTMTDTCEDAVDKWLSEGEMATPQKINCPTDDIRNYAAFANHRSYKVGCALHKWYNNKNFYRHGLLICNFGPGTYRDGPLYTAGPMCSKCPEGYYCSGTYKGLCTNRGPSEDEIEMSYEDYVETTATSVEPTTGTTKSTTTTEEVEYDFVSKGVLHNREGISAIFWLLFPNLISCFVMFITIFFS